MKPTDPASCLSRTDIRFAVGALMAVALVVAFILSIRLV